MGRKKIEIKPLTDERNRNVTFLKRKAGLMKKAYELSVLCGVSVSLLIFAGNGKPYEFSSVDFDTEVDRYNDYEGTIERRRGAEFEAMALAGEDDDDDDEDDNTRRASTSKPKPNGPSKSLKGKESFKARRVAYRDGSRDARHAGRGVDRGDLSAAIPEDASFVGGVLDDDSRDISGGPTPDSPSAAGLSYALSLHSQHQMGGPPPHPQSAQAAPWNAYRQQQAQVQGGGGGFNFPFSQSSPGGPPFPINPGMGGPPLGSVPGVGSGMNMPWDNQMLTTYAWLQIQQAHQEQKRQLLEKQQQQLLDLTSRSGGQALLRDILGPLGPAGSGGVGGASGQHAPPPAQSNWNEFVWPTAPADAPDAQGGGVSTPPDDDLLWALSGAGAQQQQQQQQQQPQPQSYQDFGSHQPQHQDLKRGRERDTDLRLDPRNSAGVGGPGGLNVGAIGIDPRAQKRRK